MAQAVADLPDPLENQPAADAPDGDADEFLSQLAGDEIDRLLAESGVERPADGAGDPAASAPAAPTGSDPAAPAGSLAAVVVSTAAPADGISIPSGDPEAGPSAGESTPFAPASAEMDSVFERMVAVDPAAAASKSAAPPAPAPQSTEPPPPSPAVEPTAPAPVAVAAPAPEASDFEKLLAPIVAEDAERGADTAPETDPAHEPAGTAPARSRASVAARAWNASLRFGLITLLEWISAPWSWLPKPVRDAAGKVGLLTLFNAAAVLIYVVFLRGRHPHHH